ncbi:ECF transporter S component [Coprothermobacter platensis]|uniref:ECF transporter S component n=1 Tax=Coprothermobacter platensis TaxID=108819 RepID=UPI000376F8A6|nr:ECF transporter S component [Coprothermobacter platensis]
MNRTRDITLTALSAAFVTVATMIIRIPQPLTRGYVNIGDAAVIAVAMVLGTKMGWIAGGLGSALADLLGGYVHWSPWTFLIKGVEAYVASTSNVKAKFDWRWVAAPALMVVGYYVVEIFMYGNAAALAEIPGNVVQGVVGAVLGPLLGKALAGSLGGMQR